ncbi:MAG TPA: alkene reductase, partial [Novosphingobium sp.]|nr:alkene reductase [Novosphingobium sp.]
MRLLEPFTLTNLALPNRAVMASLTRRRAGPGHLATPLMGEYYAQRAGAGLILSERIEVDPALAGNGQAGAPTAPALFNLAQARAWRAVVAQVHAAGGRIFAQLSHAGRISHPALRGGLAPVAPSARAAAGRIFTPAG